MMNSLFAVLLALIISTSTHTNVIQINDINELSNNQYFEEEYSIETTDVKLILLSFDDFIKKYESNDSYIIFVTKASCPYCHSLLPKYITVSEELGIKELHLLDTEILSVDEKNMFVDKYELSVVPTVYIKYPDNKLRVEIGDMDIEYVREALLPYLKGE